MSQYLIRFDRGGSERFDAIDEAAALAYVRELLIDEGAEEGDGGSLYRVDDGGRGEEEYVSEVHLGEEDTEPAPALWRQGWPID